ncbi:MAG: tRNA pseudouridine(38-40) synthase TruA, partial [Humibacillus sp.]
MRGVRIRIDLSYDGTDFRGWAVQPGLRTVQGELSAALATTMRVPSVGLVCAGRTDAGVHARGQVVHADVAPEDVASAAGRSAGPPLEALLRRVNGVLPMDVRVRGLVEAAPGFDARYSALWRRYAYRIADTPRAVDPLLCRQILTWSRLLDLDAMNKASAELMGRHDFASFCRRREGATTIRTL